MRKAATAILTQIGAIVGVALVVSGLWMWSLAEPWSVAAEKVDVALWSIRCFSTALIAGGQILFGLTVLPGLFGQPGARLGRTEQALMVVMTLVALLAAVAGAAWAAAAGW
jgi:hypothetical protein